ncbi:PREDICTED: uncharacterized protein LOC109211384 [Nicotiana attenuata]|uniref:uncharacterized protein LOC109211384 n=1 Tax=Nicotiana attenuata TaxID=49451 RepID=UPI000905999D|nr:PREDICTED: uncharacterized protein LOC109211384 [Nicotiana attenuata]
MVNSTPDSSSSSSAYTPKPSSPLFLLPSDVPGVSLVVVPFSGTSFGGWRRSMIVSLSARNKIGFIDGSCTKLAVDSPQYRQWDRCNNMVISWLINSLSPDIAESVQYSETAESIWKQLNNRYGTVNGTKPCKSCVCAAKEGLQKEKEEDRVHQSLMGLNEVYVGVRSNILMMQPLPSLDTVYNILLQDEKQRQYCKKPGHTIEKCYKLHGFPPNFKFTKGKKFGTAASAEGQTSEPSAMYPPTDQSSLIPGSQPVLMGSANFAGSTSSLPVCLNGSSTLCMLTSVAGRVWIVDSGATDHMTSNKDLLFNITPLHVPYLVSLPNGYKVKDHSMKKLLELGRMDQGLYKFHLNHSAPPTISSPNNSVLQNAEFSLHGNVPNVNHRSVPVLPCATVQTENSCHVSTLPSCTVPNNVNKNDVLWHHRLGHVPFVQIKHIPSISNDLSAKQSFICPWPLFQLDVNNAFLHGDLDEEVYMKLPQGLSVTSTSFALSVSSKYPTLVCKLQKSLYGLRQASRQWYAKLSHALYSRGYNHSLNDYSLFVKKTDSFTTLIAVYVDDIIVTEDDLKEISALKAFLDAQFKIKDLGCLTISWVLRFVIFNQRPRIPHMTAALHVLRYLKGTSDFGVLLNNSADLSLMASCDSDWADCPESRRSVSGFCIQLGAEAEYRAMSRVVAELAWLVRLLSDLGLSVALPIPILCDNQAAIHIANNPMFHERPKHIEVGCHFIRTKLADGLISLSHVSTSSQLADIFTKPLTGLHHRALIGKLGVCPPSNLRGDVGVGVGVA